MTRSAVLKRVPWARFPTDFDALVRERRASGAACRVACPNPVRVWPGVTYDDVVPFLSLPDGGFVAFWFAKGTKQAPHIACASGEGEARVIANSWADFVYRWRSNKTGVDALDVDTVAPNPTKSPARPLGPYTKRLQAFLKERSLSGAR